MQSSLGQQPKRGLGAATRSLPAINLPVILAIAGAIIVIIIAVVLFNGGKQSVDDVPDIPISGLTDTSDADEGTEAPQLATAPSSVVFSFSVADGGQSWISVYLDGSDTPVYAQVAEGPLTQDFEVTGTLRFETANIAPITLTVDGEEVTATADSSGVYVYTVDFPSFLAEWKQAHGVEGGSKTDDEGTTSNTTSTSDASNDSSSSTNTSASSNTSSTSR